MPDLKPDLNPSRGLTFVRTIKAKAIGNGKAGAEAFARSQNWANVWPVVQSIKAAVTQFGEDDFPPPAPADFDFAQFVRPLELLGRLVGLRRVPVRTRLIVSTSGSTAYWRGERQQRPISRQTFAGETLEPLSVTSMSVVTKESLMSSRPNAESVLSTDLARANVEAMDAAFVDYTNPGIVDVKPAGIAYGVTPRNSSGSTLANIDADLDWVIQSLSAAGSDLMNATFVMAPRTALYLSRLRGTGGSLVYPGMSVKGGTLLGLPALASTAVSTAIGSPTIGSTITLLDPSQIAVGDAGGRLDVSETTALQLTDTPTEGASNMVSLFQVECVALRSTRLVNWAPCRPGMAQVVDEVSY